MKLDYHHYLPIFFDGIRETTDPIRFMAVKVPAASFLFLTIAKQLLLHIQCKSSLHHAMFAWHGIQCLRSGLMPYIHSICTLKHDFI